MKTWLKFITAALSLWLVFFVVGAVQGRYEINSTSLVVAPISLLIILMSALELTVTWPYLRRMRREASKSKK